jgi:dTMP kinase
MSKPHIIVEGLDGASKGTSIETITKTLESLGFTVECSREPGGTPMAETLRSNVKQKWDETVSPKTDMMLFYAAREQLYTNVICPVLEQGKSALVRDRSWLTTYAYQLRGLSVLPDSDFWAIHNFVMLDKPKPDMVILMDIPPEVGFARIAKDRGDNSDDRMESYNLDMYNKARTGYLEIMSPSSGIADMLEIVDANRPIDIVQHDVAELVKKLVREKYS